MNTERRYALADADTEAGLVWSVGGVWSAGAAFNGATLMTVTEADRMQARHPRAVRVDVYAYLDLCHAWRAGFDSVLPPSYPGKSTPELREAARTAGREALIAAGFRSAASKANPLNPCA